MGPKVDGLYIDVRGLPFVTLQTLLGIDYPIIQAPMAGVQGSALAIAVSNAGGLGSLPCAMLDVDGIRAELAAIRAQTGRPFNVNFFCHPTPEPDAERDLIWRVALSPYYRGVRPRTRGTIPAGLGRSPFNAEIADVLEEFKPAGGELSLRPALDATCWLACARWGAKILSSATTVDEARWLEAHGVDAVIAQGLEAGGHRGIFLSDDLTTQMGTLALVPQIVRAVKIPVIAAGGIADAKGVAAAMALGAAGVQIGTAYLLCPEATTSAAASRGAEERRAACHRRHQRVHRPSRSRHRQSHHARARADERRGAGVSAGAAGRGAVAREGRKPGARRLFTVVGGAERQRLQGDARRRPDARAGRRDAFPRLSVVIAPRADEVGHGEPQIPSSLSVVIAPRTDEVGHG